MSARVADWARGLPPVADLAAATWADAPALRALADGPAAAAAVRRELLRALARTVRCDAPASAGHRRRTERHGHLTAARGRRLGPVLAAYEAAFVRVQVELWRAGRGGQRARSTLDGATWLLAAGDDLGRGYARGAGDDPDRVRAAFVDALLLGHGATALAERMAHGRADRYAVVVGVAADRAPGRWPATPTEQLHRAEAAELTVLVPAPEAPAEVLDGLVRSPAGAAAHWAATAPTPVAALAEAHAGAARAAGLARATGLPPGRLLATTEVAVEEVALGDAAVRERVDELVAHLRRRPDHARALAALHHHDLHWGRAAASLGTSRRTLEIRLAELRCLTGVAATSTTGVQLWGLALVAAALCDGTGQPS